MKLHTLLENIETILTNSPFDDKKLKAARLARMEKRYASTDSSDISGIGSQAFVTQSKEDQMRVSRETHVSHDQRLLDHGYHQFALLALNNQDNPCFPKIDKVKIKEDPNWRIIPRYIMEKLYHFHDLSPELLMALGKRYFFDFEELIAKSYGRSSIVSMNKDAIMYTIADHLKKCISDHNFDCIKDTQLLKALKLIARNQGDNANDLHIDNIMLRNVGTFWQIVITDPWH